ncbi:hypothetical protein Adt_24111 [Abeliophyllum distichum]|uniref:Uncharacterized protein n=1 Tax=Abeliophyllum distichum TaxID=126358 RepID=A0ABD1SCS4_9LAMI
MLQSYFDLQGDRSLDKYRAVCAADKFIEMRETQLTQVASSDRSVDKRAIAREVFEEQRVHVCRLCQMEKKIAHLTANLEQRLPDVVLDDDEEIGEDENGYGGLGDP